MLKISSEACSIALCAFPWRHLCTRGVPGMPVAPSWTSACAAVRPLLSMAAQLVLNDVMALRSRLPQLLRGRTHTTAGRDAHSGAQCAAPRACCRGRKALGSPHSWSKLSRSRLQTHTSARRTARTVCPSTSPPQTARSPLVPSISPPTCWSAPRCIQHSVLASSWNDGPLCLAAAFGAGQQTASATCPVAEEVAWWSYPRISWEGSTPMRLVFQLHRSLDDLLACGQLRPSCAIVASGPC